MSRVLHAIEKSIIASLQQKQGQTQEELTESTGLSLDRIRRGVEWLRLKDLAYIHESRSHTARLDINGIDALENGLPERRLLNMLAGGPQSLRSAKERVGPPFGAAMGTARKNGWITTERTRDESDAASSDGKLLLHLATGPVPERLPGEATLEELGERSLPVEALDADDLMVLSERPKFVIFEALVQKTITLTDEAMSTDADDAAAGAGGAIDVEAAVPRALGGRTHPLKDVINEIREIFVTMGFAETSGNVVQSCFWNFDALMTPQDHPSREMQDTFYLDGLETDESVEPGHLRLVGDTHSDVWRQPWNIDESRRMVLRTHTTCVTLRYLAEHQDMEQCRVFSLGKVFRNEKTSYKHLAEFTQVEGVVREKGATIRDLMGIQEEFYRRLGLARVRFWPTFFPYTEPSFQSMVYNERLGKWMELFGMGIFHPFVTACLKDTTPVLAWGGGVERIAMIKYGIDDVREFYANNIGWLREARPCQ